jgi:hypothetical protein
VQRPYEKSLAAHRRLVNSNSGTIEIGTTIGALMEAGQGADHTAGNLPVFDCKDKTTEELVTASLGIQTACAAADSLWL